MGPWRMGRLQKLKRGRDFGWAVVEQSRGLQGIKGGQVGFRRIGALCGHRMHGPDPGNRHTGHLGAGHAGAKAGKKTVLAGQAGSCLDTSLLTWSKSFPFWPQFTSH